MSDRFELRAHGREWLASFAGIIPIALLAWMLADLQPWTKDGLIGVLVTVILLTIMAAFFVLSIWIAIGLRRAKIVVDSTALIIHGVWRITHIPIKEVDRIRYGLPTPSRYLGHCL